MVDGRDSKYRNIVFHWRNGNQRAFVCARDDGSSRTA